jgi:hypothetical protein
VVLQSRIFLPVHQCKNFKYDPLKGSYLLRAVLEISLMRALLLCHCSLPVLKLHIYAKNGEKYAESTVLGKRRKDEAKCRFWGVFCYIVLLSNVKIGLRLSKRLFEAVK